MIEALVNGFLYGLIFGGAAALLVFFVVHVCGAVGGFFERLPEDPEDAQRLVLVCEWQGTWRKRDGTPRYVDNAVYGCFLDADFALMCFREELKETGWVGGADMHHIVDLARPDLGYLDNTTPSTVRSA